MGQITPRGTKVGLLLERELVSPVTGISIQETSPKDSTEDGWGFFRDKKVK
jgi:hypothetical protein